jgi:hypothetical protein
MTSPAIYDRRYGYFIEGKLYPPSGTAEAIREQSRQRFGPIAGSDRAATSITGRGGDPNLLVVQSVGNPNQVQQLSEHNQQTLLENPQKLNSYSYSQDNPINSKDPSGLSYIQLAYMNAQGSVFGTTGIRIDQYGIVYFAGAGTGVGEEEGGDAELSAGTLSHTPQVNNENSVTYTEEGVGGTGSVVTSKIPNCPSCPADASTEVGVTLGAGASAGTVLEYSYPLITWGTPPPDYNTVIGDSSFSYLSSQHTEISAYNPQTTRVSQSGNEGSSGGIPEAALGSIKAAVEQISALISTL